MIGLEILAAPSCEVVIAGRPEGRTRPELLEVIRRRYLPA